MDHKLSVLVQVDLDHRSVHLVITGCLTAANQHALYPVIRRARSLVPPVTLSIDLTTADRVEAVAVDLLRWAVEHEEPVPGVGPVRILTPASMSECGSAPDRLTDSWQPTGPLSG